MLYDYVETGKAEIISGEDITPAEAGIETADQTTAQQKKVAIIACGNMVEESVKCRDRLISEAGITPLFINARFIKPLDEALLRRITGKYDIIAFAEETCEAGSFGERAVAIIQDELSMLLNGEKYELGSSKEDIKIPKIINFCIKEESVPQGSVEELREMLGISADCMYDKITGML